MGDLDKRLIVTLAQLDFLLPEGVFSDNEGADAFSHEPVNDGSGSHMQVVVDTAVLPFVGGRPVAGGGEGSLVWSVFSDPPLPFLFPPLSLSSSTISEDNAKTHRP